MPDRHTAIDPDEGQEDGSLAQVEGVLLHKRQIAEELSRAHTASKRARNPLLKRIDADESEWDKRSLTQFSTCQEGI